jgi:hypothetical protein
MQKHVELQGEMGNRIHEKPLDIAGFIHIFDLTAHNIQMEAQT